jgi:hypothetical protein
LGHRYDPLDAFERERNVLTGQLKHHQKALGVWLQKAILSERTVLIVGIPGNLYDGRGFLADKVNVPRDCGYDAPLQSSCLTLSES